MNIIKKIGIFKIVLAVLAVLMLFVPNFCAMLASGGYLLNVINYVLVYAVASSGLNIMSGYSGQINLGGAAYFS